jgi:hypothetical protein
MRRTDPIEILATGLFVLSMLVIAAGAVMVLVAINNWVQS